jgi:hypothetical protein
MKPLTLAAAILAALSLAACGGQSAPVAPAAATAPAATCKQQSDAWRTANKSVLNRFKASVRPFAGGTVTSAQAHALSAGAQAAENAPPPACADPKGLYGQALAQLVTAGSAAGGGGSLSELGALAPMETAETDLSQLTAELYQTIGSGKL